MSCRNTCSPLKLTSETIARENPRRGHKHDGLVPGCCIQLNKYTLRKPTDFKLAMPTAARTCSLPRVVGPGSYQHSHERRTLDLLAGHREAACRPAVGLLLLFYGRRIRKTASVRSLGIFAWTATTVTQLQASKSSLLAGDALCKSSPRGPSTMYACPKLVLLSMLQHHSGSLRGQPTDTEDEDCISGVFEPRDPRQEQHTPYENLSAKCAAIHWLTILYRSGCSRSSLCRHRNCHRATGTSLNATSILPAHLQTL